MAYVDSVQSTCENEGRVRGEIGGKGWALRSIDNYDIFMCYNCSALARRSRRVVQIINRGVRRTGLNAGVDIELHREGP